MLVHAPELFEEAERFLYAEPHRNFGRRCAAFEIDYAAHGAFEWDDAKKSAFEAKIKERLQLSAPCLIQHFPIEQADDEGATRVLHMFLIRHAGLTSSVQNTLPDLSLQPIHYRPPVEATLLFQPKVSRIEVFAHEASERPRLWRRLSPRPPRGRTHRAGPCRCGSTTWSASTRPCTFRKSRFSTYLGVLDVRVVEVEARPEDFNRRLQMKVASCSP